MAAAKSTKATKAIEADGADEATEKAEAKAKAAPRPSAILGNIDFSGIDETELANAPVRKSPWDDVLDEVYEATAEGKVPRDENGNLKFVKIGSYAQGQSAKAQIKSFATRKLDETYEFKVHGKDLLVRVRETSED